MVCIGRFHPPAIETDIHSTNLIGFTTNSVIFLLLIVSRSKLIPDFALTIHFIHLVLVSLYTRSLPTNLLWWGLQLSSAAVMTFGAMWACQRRELQPIAFGLGGTSTRADHGNGSYRTQTGADDDDVTLPLRTEHGDLESGLGDGVITAQEPLTPGLGRGRRGRNRDSSGDYEMTVLNGKEDGILTTATDGAE
jgi:protein SYS1